MTLTDIINGMTPGEWRAVAAISRWNVTTSKPPRTLNICTLNTDRMEQEANAAAIALAPKGVKALTALNGLLGLIDLIEGRDDVSDELRGILLTNHRVIDARALLEGVEP